METEIDARKSARENLNSLYSRLRALKEKKAGLQKALEQTKKEIKEAKAPEENLQPSLGGQKGANPQTESGGQKGAMQTKFGKDKHSHSGKASKKPKEAWHIKFNSFFTSGGKVCVAGSNAKENDELYSRHLGKGDLFFHADIQGAPAVILKGGQGANENELKEAAQWAASFSSAWKIGASEVDVYAIKPEQVSKNAQGGYVGRGAFAIEGERMWFRNTELKLKIGKLNEEAKALPSIHEMNLSKEIFLTPGTLAKEEACKQLSSLLGAKADFLSSLLPSGKFAILK